MNVVINRLELLSAAKRAANIAPAESPLEVLRGVLLETDAAAITLTATNLEVALEQKAPCESKDYDALVINARLFAEMVEKLSGERVTLYRQGKCQNLTIKGGEATFSLNVWEKGSFPKVEIPFPEDTVKVTGIPSMAKRTVFAVDPRNDQPLLKSVNLMFTQTGLRSVGSDGNCIVSAKGDDKSTGDVNLLLRSRGQREVHDSFGFMDYSCDWWLCDEQHGRPRLVILFDCNFCGHHALPGAVAESRTELKNQIIGLKKALADLEPQPIITLPVQTEMKEAA